MFVAHTFGPGEVDLSEISFIKESLQNLHTSLLDSLEGLSSEQAHWRPNDQGNHIAFVAWHYTRTVDNIIRFVLQKHPTVWMEKGWDARFGLDSKAQGTGMSPEDSAALKVSSIPDFRSYMTEVWSETRDYLGNVTEDDLAQSMNIRPLGEMTLAQLLGTVLLTHGYTHLGEIWLLKGLQGLQGSPI